MGVLQTLRCGVHRHIYHVYGILLVSVSSHLDHLDYVLIGAVLSRSQLLPLPKVSPPGTIGDVLYLSRIGIIFHSWLISSVLLIMQFMTLVLNPPVSTLAGPQVQHLTRRLPTYRTEPDSTDSSQSLPLHFSGAQKLPTVDCITNHIAMTGYRRQSSTLR